MDDVKGLPPHAAGPAASAAALSSFVAEPILPRDDRPKVSQRWAISVELLLAILLNLAFLVALFYRVAPDLPPMAKEPPAISVDLVPEPKPQPQPQPKPKPPAPPPPKAEEKAPEQPKEQPKLTEKFRESGGDPSLKQGRAPKVEAEMPKAAPEKKAEKPKPEAPKQPAADLPDWIQSLDRGYDLPKPNESSSTASRGRNTHDSLSERMGEGGGDAYLNQIVSQVSTQLRYPQEANGARGLVFIGIVIDRAGHLQSMTMLRPSGNGILDRAAMEAVRRSAPFRPLPADFPAPATVTLRVPVTPRQDGGG